jgi:hypothetical protein
MGAQANDQERFFSVQREAVDTAIRLANDSGKAASTAVALALGDSSPWAISDDRDRHERKRMKDERKG